MHTCQIVGYRLRDRSRRRRRMSREGMVEWNRSQPVMAPCRRRARGRLPVRCWLRGCIAPTIHLGRSSIEHCLWRRHASTARTSRYFPARSRRNVQTRSRVEPSVVWILLARRHALIVIQSTLIDIASVSGLRHVCRGRVARSIIRWRVEVRLRVDSTKSRPRRWMSRLHSGPLRFLIRR